jgi:hypothetical protein
MKKVAAALAVSGLVLLTSTLSSKGQFYSPGTPNAWDFNTPMIETSSGSGIWDYTWTGTTGTPELFDILAQAGNWDSKVHPSGNQWVTPDPGLGGGNTLTLDVNTYSDGWFPVNNRVKVASELTTAWTAVGDWQAQIGGGDWDFSNPNTVMSDLGGGIFGFTATLNPGTYKYKAVKTGTWDAIGGNSRNVNADDLSFTTAGEPVEMLVNVLDGTVQVNLIPEPATVGLLGGGAMLLLLLRRRTQ